MITDLEIPEVSEINYFSDNDMLNNNWEVIVKYHGDLAPIARDISASIELLGRGYAIITLARSNIGRLYLYPQIEHIELPKRLSIEGPYNLVSTCIRNVQSASTYGLTGRGVIVAIIDSGIDYTHPDFQTEDGSSRILYIWDQTASGAPPAGFSQGIEYTQSQLTDALRTGEPLAVIPNVDTNGHGTAIAGIAVGNGRASRGENIGVAPEADIISVKLGTRGFQSFARTTELMRAIKYVLQKAQQLERPIAINISFGTNNGSHLGVSLFETYISDMAMEWKTSIIVPTGNEGYAGHHYAGEVSSSQTFEIDFFTAPGINSFFICLWKNIVDIFSVEIVFPNGRTTGVIGIEKQIKVVRDGNIIASVIYGQPSHYSANQEIYFNFESTGGPIGSGLWKLRIIAERIVDGRVDLWLPTLEEVTADTFFSGAMQYNTQTIPSTARRVISVAGYNDRLGSISEFSGRGNQNQALPNPDLAAPAVDILSAKTGGGYDSFTGTSIAAPFVTGSAALMMQWGIVNGNDPFLYGERIRAFLRLGANRSKNEYPNPSFGYGTLCLNTTVQYLEQYRWGGMEVWQQI